MQARVVAEVIASHKRAGPDATSTPTERANDGGENEIDTEIARRAFLVAAKVADIFLYGKPNSER